MIGEEAIERVLRDVRATTSLAFGLRPAAGGGVTFWLDDRYAGSLPCGEDDAAWLADHVQDQYVIELLGAA